MRRTGQLLRSSAHPPVVRPSIYPSTHPFVHPSICPSINSCLSLHLSICRPFNSSPHPLVHASIHQLTHPSVRPWSLRSSIYLPVHLSAIQEAETLSRQNNSELPELRTSSHNRTPEVVGGASVICEQSVHLPGLTRIQSSGFSEATTEVSY